MYIVSKKTVWHGNFLKTVLITYKNRDGKEHTWEAVERIGVAGVVVILPVTSDNELILIRQYRPTIASYVIELPAGLIEPGEDFIQACRRELIEETGHDSDEFSLIAEGVMSTGITSDIWKVVLARNTRLASEGTRRRFPPDPNEDIETIKVPLEDLDTLLEEFSQTGDYPDLRIQGLVSLYLKKHKRP